MLLSIRLREEAGYRRNAADVVTCLQLFQAPNISRLTVALNREQQSDINIDSFVITCSTAGKSRLVPGF